MEKEHREKLEKNLWKVQAIQILLGMMFFAPIIVLFWQENGLSLTEIMILQSIFSMAIVLLEVPSGYFADIFGRKKSLIGSGTFFLLGVITYAFGTNFYHFLIAEILWAFGLAFTSGADSALLYDTLIDLKREKEFKKIWGSAIFFRLIGMSISSIIGGLIGQINFRYTFYLVIPFMASIIPIAFSIKEPKRHKMIFEKGYLFELLQILKNSFIKNIKLRWVIICAAVIYCFNQAALWLYQPYFEIIGIEIFYFGFIFAAFNVVAAISSKYAYKIENKFGKRDSLILIIFLMTISYFLMSKILFAFSFMFIFIQQFVRGANKPIIADYTNQLAPSQHRATILSAQSLVGRLFYALMLPVVGWVADVYTIPQALTMIGITSAVVGSITLIALRKNHVI